MRTLLQEPRRDSMVPCTEMVAMKEGEESRFWTYFEVDLQDLLIGSGCAESE